jgi:SH3-like domain-containing protein
MKKLAALLFVLLGAASLSAAAAEAQRQPPYYASISASRAMMRTGPGRNYPGIWLYVRADLPVRIVAVYDRPRGESWRKVQDPDGTTGWMLVNLLSDQRTAIVRSTQPQPMRESPDEGARVRFRAAPGVVGRVSRCGDGWCRFDVHGRDGYIRVDALWGVEPNERIG